MCGRCVAMSGFWSEVFSLSRQEGTVPVGGSTAPGQVVIRAWRRARHDRLLHRCHVSWVGFEERGVFARQHGSLVPAELSPPVLEPDLETQRTESGVVLKTMRCGSKLHSNKHEDYPTTYWNLNSCVNSSIACEFFNQLEVWQLSWIKKKFVHFYNMGIHCNIWETVIVCGARSDRHTLSNFLEAPSQPSCLLQLVDKVWQLGVGRWIDNVSLVSPKTPQLPDSMFVALMWFFRSDIDKSIYQSTLTCLYNTHLMWVWN